MTADRTEGPPTLVGLALVGLALVVPLALLPATLATAGIAPLVVAALAGLMVGVPTARALRRQPPEEHPVWSALWRIARDLTIGATLAGGTMLVLRPLPLVWALALAVAGWAGAVGLATRDWRSRLVPGVLAVVVALGTGLVAVVRGPAPVTALVPHWAHLSDALAPALIAGLWLGGLAPGQWQGPRRPGTKEAPWATAGLALLGTLGAGIAVASGYERSLQWSSVEVGASIALGLALLGAASTWLANRERPARTGVAGLLATVWLAGPAASIVGLLAVVGLPMALVSTTALAGRRARGVDGVLVGLAVLTALLAAGSGFGDHRLASLDEAITLGLSVVAAFWIAATAVARARTEVPT